MTNICERILGWLKSLVPSRIEKAFFGEPGIDIPESTVEYRPNLNAIASAPVNELAARLEDAARDRTHVSFSAESPSSLHGAHLRDALRLELDIGGFGVRIASVEFEDVVDLSGLHIAYPLQFSNCMFRSPILLDDSKLGSLKLVDCEILRISATNSHISQDLEVSECQLSSFGITSEPSVPSLDLAGAAVDGSLNFRNLSVLRPASSLAVDASNLTITRDMHWIGGRVEGCIALENARVGGSCRFAQVDLRADPCALDFRRGSVGGELFLGGQAGEARTNITGRVSLHSLKVVASLTIDNVSLMGSSGAGRDLAVLASRMHVEEDVCFGQQVELHGTVQADTCRIGGAFDFRPWLADVSGSVALDLTKATVVGDVILRPPDNRELTEPSIRGAVLLGSTTVGANLDLRDLSICDPPPDSMSRGSADPLLFASGIRVAGDIDVRGADVRGGPLWFKLAHVAGDVNLSGATLHNRGGHTATFHQAEVGGSIHAGTYTVRDDYVPKAFTSIGLVAFNHCRIAGRLRFERAVLEWRGEPNKQTNAEGSAFEGIAADVAVGIVLDWDRVIGKVDLRRAKAGYLSDRPDSWGSGHFIAGFRYERLEPLPTGANDESDNWDVGARAAWLAGAKDYDFGSWEYAASVLRARGLDSEAEDLLIRGKRAERASFGWGPAELGRRIRSLFHERLVGFGYRPRRALVALLLLLAATAIISEADYRAGSLRATDERGAIYNVNGLVAGSGVPDPSDSDEYLSSSCGGGRVICFQPVLFAVDTVVPLIDLGQRSEWRSARGSGADVPQFVYDIGSLMGWLLSTVAALSLSRVDRSVRRA